jgi:hypothetical protein
MVGFMWRASSYAEARAQVDLARNPEPPFGDQLARSMCAAIRSASRGELGGLACPSPLSDPDRAYRVTLDGTGRPQIQCLDSDGRWRST